MQLATATPKARTRASQPPPIGNKTVYHPKRKTRRPKRGGAQAMNVQARRFVDLFAGIGGFHFAAREHGPTPVLASQERRKDGRLVLLAGGRHAHGIAAGDVALWDRQGVGRRRKVVQVAVARADGRCEVAARGIRYNAQASTLTVVHKGQGARWETGQAPRTRYLRAPRPAPG